MSKLCIMPDSTLTRLKGKKYKICKHSNTLNGVCYHGAEWMGKKITRVSNTSHILSHWKTK